MALDAVGFHGAITESQEARRWWAAGVVAVRQSFEEFKVRPAGGLAFKITPGVLNVCGVAVSLRSEAHFNYLRRENSSRRVSVFVRVKWAGTNSLADVYAYTLGQGEYADWTQNPGVEFEVPVAIIDVPAGASTITQGMITQVAPVGGLSGPLMVENSRHISQVYGHEGAIIETIDDRKRWRIEGKRRVEIIDAKAAWKFYTPQVTYHGKNGRQQVGLGNGGWVKGRYKIVNGWVQGDIEIHGARTGTNWGAGPIDVSLPPGYPLDSWGVDTWQNAHVFVQHPRHMDFHAQALGKAGESTLRIFVPLSLEHSQIANLQAADPNNNVAGTGIPHIPGQRTEPYHIVIQLKYPVPGE